MPTYASRALELSGRRRSWERLVGTLESQGRPGRMLAWSVCEVQRWPSANRLRAGSVERELGSVRASHQGHWSPAHRDLGCQAALSLFLAFRPREKSLLQVAALGAALLISLQLTLIHRFHPAG